jgi:hypothetical protein
LVTVDPEPGGPTLLFFSPTQGVLVVAGSQDSFQGTFYTTASGGRT